ncbi:MAG: hypothetical protein JWP87_2128 [Labilithrix sp.]|nr:hypothetical protein [Labilithrix sp.]
MLEIALLFSTIASWAPTLGYLDAGTTHATIAQVFFGVWAAGGLLALVLHKPIERNALAHHTQPA